jgi:hypothetical protein
MKFLCLAYGDEPGWDALSDEEKREVLAQDAVIRDRGNVVSAVEGTVTAVRNWDGNRVVTREPVARNELPLAGFYVVESETVEEVIELVSNTPCARARGVIEIRSVRKFRDEGA